MASESGRDDFIIAIRSAFLKKGTRQKFSLFTLLIISIFVLSLEYFKSGPVDKFRSIIKDFIFKGSHLVSSPFLFIEKNYYNFQNHMKLYDEYELMKEKKLNMESLNYEIQFLKAENNRLNKLIEERKLNSDSYLLTKVLLDQQSPYLKSIIINKGFKHGLKNGSAVLEKAYYIGKIIEVNHLTSRVLLASDLNSKVPVLIEPGGINAILSGNGKDSFAELEYLPKEERIKEGDIVYTSGIDGDISAAIPVGKVFIDNKKKFVNFFVDFNQIKFVKIKN
mgnify:CR=1 FL=1|tara:strand:- start:9997 stop:10833 length:837 start_codon:yes stop_codon:yes gene_type:complete